MKDKAQEIEHLARGIRIGCQYVLNHGQAMATANYLHNVLGYAKQTPVADYDIYAHGLKDGIKYGKEMDAPDTCQHTGEIKVLSIGSIKGTGEVKKVCGQCGEDVTKCQPSTMNCQHANEVPHKCICPEDCYCKREGSCQPKEWQSEDRESIFDLVEGFISVDPKDLKAYTEAYDKILPKIVEIIQKRKRYAAKARQQIINGGKK